MGKFKKLWSRLTDRAEPVDGYQPITGTLRSPIDIDEYARITVNRWYAVADFLPATALPDRNLAQALGVQSSVQVIAKDRDGNRGLAVLYKAGDRPAAWGLRYKLDRSFNPLDVVEWCEIPK